jgi:ubiquinone/menaquinone biosynthesis C-methylase UbiE
MDYDKSNIAATYDEARGLTVVRQRRWRDLLAAHVERSRISLIVDLGCGTGRFSEILAAEFGARIIGLDPSESMIDQARQKSATGMIEFERAWAHELPLADGCVDLVFMSQVYHHLAEPIAAARECRRILRAGSYLCVRTATRENDVVIARFFPRVRTMRSSRNVWPRTGRNSYESRPFAPTRSWRVCPTRNSITEWPRCVRMSLRLIQTMP